MCNCWKVYFYRAHTLNFPFNHSNCFPSYFSNSSNFQGVGGGHSSADHHKNHISSSRGRGAGGNTSSNNNNNTQLGLMSQVGTEQSLRQRAVARLKMFNFNLNWDLHMNQCKPCGWVLRDDVWNGGKLITLMHRQSQSFRKIHSANDPVLEWFCFFCWQNGTCS